LTRQQWSARRDFPHAFEGPRDGSVDWSNTAPIRGAKLRLREAKSAKRLLVLETEADDRHLARRPKRVATPPAFSVLAYVPRAEGDTTREAIVFFDPPQTLKHLLLRGGDADIEIVQAQIFTDAPDNELFEQSEDFGEHADLPPHAVGRDCGRSSTLHRHGSSRALPGAPGAAPLPEHDRARHRRNRDARGRRL